MNVVHAEVVGIAPLLQHKYPMPTLLEMKQGGKKTTGSKDYTEEWRDSLYLTQDKEIYQPATHFEAAMVGAAVNYKIPGKRGKTYKFLFKAAVFVAPDVILHGMSEPKELDTDEQKRLYIDARPVVVQRARVVRLRPAFSAGWKLEFDIEIADNEIAPSLVNEVLTLAGQSVGIGDFRPKFGRFMVTRFEVDEVEDDTAKKVQAWDER